MMDLDDRSTQVLEVYLDWLKSLVGAEWYGESYHFLLEQLFHTEYFWTVPNDENRAEDGKALREEFTDYFPHFLDNEALVGPPTVLEVLIALARRVDFEVTPIEMGEDVTRIFWKLVGNLHLLGFDDRLFGYYEVARTDEILSKWMQNKVSRGRWYSPFWNENPDFNPRKTEIWAQMHHYLAQKGGF